jgi:hypothetical protein
VVSNLENFAAALQSRWEALTPPSDASFPYRASTAINNDEVGLQHRQFRFDWSQVELESDSATATAGIVRVLWDVVVELRLQRRGRAITVLSRAASDEARFLITNFVRAADAVWGTGVRHAEFLRVRKAYQPQFISLFFEFRVVTEEV